jgi:hypothetical protein
LRAHVVGEFWPPTPPLRTPAIIAEHMAARSAQPAAYDARAQDQADRDSQRPAHRPVTVDTNEKASTVIDRPTGNSRDRQQVPSLAERLWENRCCQTEGLAQTPAFGQVAAPQNRGKSVVNLPGGFPNAALNEEQLRNSTTSRYRRRCHCRHYRRAWRRAALVT